MGELKKLNKKQEIFVAELIKGKSQRQAYLIAYDCGKVSPSTIDRRASELFNKPEVKARYNKINQKVVKEIEQDAIITKKRIIDELAAIAFANVADYSKIEWVEEKITKNGRSKTIRYQTVRLTETEKLTETQQRAISGIKQTKEGIEVKFYSKPEALTKLYDILYSEDNTANEDTMSKLDEIAAGLDKLAIAEGGE